MHTFNHIDYIHHIDYKDPAVHVLGEMPAIEHAPKTKDKI